MIFSEPLETVIRRRYSVRTYRDKPIPDQVKQEITDYINTLSSPFPAKPTFSIVEPALADGGAKLGTYGMIRGASVFIASETDESEYAIDAIGYEFEKLILFITTLGLGTCWLGGTYNRSDLQKAMGESDGSFIPAISPVGYFDKKGLHEILVRGVVRADSRKPWETLFFDGNFSQQLTQENAGKYAFPLEMVRLGPSASNKQPWRIVREAGRYHFYEARNPGYSAAFRYDIQCLDMGIAACHFHLAATEKGLEGKFVLDAAPAIALPENTVYKYSWLPDE